MATAVTALVSVRGLTERFQADEVWQANRVASSYMVDTASCNVPRGGQHVRHLR